MSAPTQTPGTEPSLGELVAQLTDVSTRLVHDEVEHAKAELRDDVRHAGAGIGLVSAAGLLAFFAVGTLVTAAVAALALVVDVWLAALVVAAVLLLAAGVAALVGKREVAEAGPPLRTAESVRDDVAVAKGARR
jgi:uncharacterized membrane protein YqjE